MTYQATMTSKGQITIPKALREILGLSTAQKIQMSIMPDQAAMVITPASDFLKIAKTITPKRRLDVLKGRQAFATHYDRV